MSDKDKILDEILHLVERHYKIAYKAIESKARTNPKDIKNI
jgi:hypothetical protein